MTDCCNEVNGNTIDNLDSLRQLNRKYEHRLSELEDEIRATKSEWNEIIAKSMKENILVKDSLSNDKITNPSNQSEPKRLKKIRRTPSKKIKRLPWLHGSNDQLDGPEPPLFFYVF